MKGVELVGGVFEVTNSRHVITITNFDEDIQKYYVALDTGWEWKWVTQTTLQAAISRKDIVRVFPCWKHDSLPFARALGELRRLGDGAIESAC